MKKFALALMSASAAVFGFGLVASAQGYDPAISVDPASPAPGGAYTVTYENCFVGDTITFTQADSTPTSVQGECVPVSDPSCSVPVLGSMFALVQAPSLGCAVGMFDAAPTEAGVYNGTAVGAQSPSLPFQFEIEAETTPTDPTTTSTTIASGAMADTGANGIGTTTNIAIGLLVVGLGLFVVAQIRRRQAPTTV